MTGVSASTARAPKPSVALLQQALHDAQHRARTELAPERAPTTEMSATAPHPITRLTPPSASGPVVTVIGAHPGAGCSSVALALADAAASTGAPVHLLELAGPLQSGLLTVTTVEHPGAPAGWRRGTRGSVTVDRYAAAADTENADAAPGMAADTDLDPHNALTVIDAATGPYATTDPHAVLLVVVCRATVPGVRHAERLLHLLDGPVIVAAVGAPRWAGEVSATLGPRLKALRDEARLFMVPHDRHLEVSGPCADELPKAVLAAAHRLLHALGIDPLNPTPHRRAVRHPKGNHS